MSVLRTGLGTLLMPLFVLGLCGCATTHTHRPDPLLNRIIRASDQQEIPARQMYEIMAEAQVVYLGETHDNPYHHHIQEAVVQALIQLNKRPAIGFEVFSLEQTGFLMHHTLGEATPFIKKSDLSEEGMLRRSLGWGRDRDEDWQFYFPLLRLAKGHRLPAFGVDLPQGIRLRLSRVGLEGLSSLERGLLYPTGFDDPAYRQFMYEELTRSHCGWTSPELLRKLYETWLARNDAMARAIVDMVKDQRGEPVVVILGAGHVQHNLGVYERVAYMLPGVRQVNVGLHEIAIEPLTLDDYLRATELGGTNLPPEHEYFWFTPRVSYEDPCERFKDHLKRRDAATSRQDNK